MINLENVVDILGNFISERLTISLTSINGLKDEEVAAILFENGQSILNCTSYAFENEDILDHDFNIELNDKSPFENNENDDCNRNNNSGDADCNDECKNENIVRHQSSFEYTKNVQLCDK